MERDCSSVVGVQCGRTGALEAPTQEPALCPWLGAAHPGWSSSRDQDRAEWEIAMRIGGGEHTYDWIDDWARIPDTESARGGWAHPVVAIDEAGRILTFHAGDPTVLVFDQDGRLLESVRTELTEGHGITVTKEGDTEYIWVADSGSKRVRKDGQLVQTNAPTGQVV